MFTNVVRPKKKAPVQRNHPPDILLPGLATGHYQHVGREPDTNYEVQMLHYNLRKTEEREKEIEAAIKLSQRESVLLKNQEKVDKSYYRRLIKEKVEKQIEAYENAVEQRRIRLRDLLCKEEREQYYETVDAAQKGVTTKMEEMKQRAEILRAANEAERQEIVRQKRIQQYKARSQELRPYLANKHRIESKNAQLQQIRENEARREAERELEKMYYHLTMRELEARVEREQQDAIMQKRRQDELLDTWSKQVRGKELLREEMAKVAEEDRMEMLKFEAQFNREKLESEQEKHKNRERLANELQEQIAVQNRLLAQRKKEEDALNEALINLRDMEIQKEKDAVQDFTSQARKESMMYRKHLKELADIRKKEEAELQALLNQYQTEVQRKQDEKKCKEVNAKRRLQESVLQERAEQIKYKQQEAARQLKAKQEENELLRIAFKTNGCLQEESERLEKMAVLQYRDDLQKQIAYNNMLREKEREEIERQLRRGEEEEEEYKRFLKLVMEGEFSLGEKHPFRAVLEKFDCSCPPKSQ